MNAHTPILLSFINFPKPTEGTNEATNTKVFVDGLQCSILMKHDVEHLACKAPTSMHIGAVPITFEVNGKSYTTNLEFTYFDLSMTGQSQTSNIPAGGGVLTIVGTHLDVANKVMIKDTVVTGCTFEPTQITCPIPPNTPGQYEVNVLANDTIYTSPFLIEYIGPNLDHIEPAFGNQMRPTTITLFGNDFGETVESNSVLVGDVPCTNPVIIGKDNGMQLIQCLVPPMEEAGDKPVVIKVSGKSNGGQPVASVNKVTFHSTGLSCRGPPNEDGSNPPVDWWFSYKLRMTQNNSYLYIDNTMDELAKHDNLAGVTSGPYSALAATYDQYPDYYYMFFNDQLGGRDAAGSRTNPQSPKHGHGHLKSFILFEQDPATKKYRGITVMHSNPVFPGFTGTGNTFYGINDGIKWLGSPRYSQHFFCYQWDDIETQFDYIIHNDAGLIDQNYKAPDLSKWDDNTKNQYPYFYDYMTEWESLPARVPGPNGPPQCTQDCFHDACQDVVAKETNLNNICHWVSPNINISGMVANYFMKTSIELNKAKFPPISDEATSKLSPFIAKNERSNVYEGVDTWMVVADHYQRMMFIEFFYAIGMYQMSPTNSVINVGSLYLPPNLSERVWNPRNGTFTYKEYIFSGRTNDHSKMGFPVYPAVGDNVRAPNENMFCVGDSNRHNGQGIRGGGALCFQHPTLSYQFNRMVREYNSINAGSKTTQRPGTDAQYFINSVTQPLKINRNDWTNDITFEVMDSVNGTISSRLPRYFGVANESTLGSPQDIVAEIPVMRTSMSKVGPEALDLGNIPPQPSIKGYVADDTVAVNYIAHDSSIASICDYQPSQYPDEVCDRKLARRTPMPESQPSQAPVLYPTNYEQPYMSPFATRSFETQGINDLQVISYTKDVRSRLTEMPSMLPPIQYIINPSAQVPSVTGKYTTRKVATKCEEELAYDVVISYVYQQSSYRPQSEVIYIIDNNLPNWANGVLYAISKYIHNSFPPIQDKTTAFDQCVVQYFPNMTNIVTYKETRPQVKGTQWQLFYRTAAATWDMLNPTISDGKGGRINRATLVDMIPYDLLLSKLIELKPSDGVDSLQKLLTALGNPVYDSVTNRKSLENNYLISKRKS
ncbi:hypothetical protein SAMD00019534_069820 [Acytostelium subglobosum LB1]|uniref:hypothetical protein n=1 Tax=Acytostelium subglobosum LB1 TaxID=1410327 RepID=UPI000644ABB8|nr:hypothetical protein SAMD00019534_069820 [Acytostelium subglobosum LB1]GAM23807.1 hypothetical protein SAMD00019534_069820 [Acytostelium subglobosum LB1]|eukprot:XP_012753548.1 hypothetical protein SAMD00019534_069820 [Acytostelium subglobosum LB1]